jgi:hypothetical protein
MGGRPIPAPAPGASSHSAPPPPPVAPVKHETKLPCDPALALAGHLGQGVSQTPLKHAGQECERRPEQVQVTTAENHPNRLLPDGSALAAPPGGQDARGMRSGYDWEGAGSSVSARGLDMPPDHDVFGEIGPFRNKDDITIFPRRRAGQDKLGSTRPPIVISGSVLESYFNMPQQKVCEKLVSFPGSA